MHGLPGRRRHVIAEDHRNLNALVLPEEAGGFGLDGVWSDDYHHELRRLLAGDHDGYFADFTGTTAALSRTIGRGWLYSGQYARFFERPRGTDPGGIPLGRFVHFIQNHDQEGGLALRRGGHLLLVALRDGVTLPLDGGAVPTWSTEEARYTPEPNPPVASGTRVSFPRAAALLATIPGP